MKHRTTAEQKSRWKKLDKAATTGPWTTDKHCREGEVWSPMEELICEGTVVDPAKYRANAEFICAAREAVPVLLKEVAEGEERYNALLLLKDMAVKEKP